MNYSYVSNPCTFNQILAWFSTFKQSEYISLKILPVSNIILCSIVQTTTTSKHSYIHSNIRDQMTDGYMYVGHTAYTYTFIHFGKILCDYIVDDF